MLIEDEDDFREPIQRYLTIAGMIVEGVRSVKEMDAHLKEFSPDIMVLDINLPEISGFEVISRLRRETKAGLIMLTARGALDDRLFAFGEGADHYLTKPVAANELEAVIRALFSRINGQKPETEATWIFDVEEWVLISPDGERGLLSAAEHRVLTLLTATPGQPVARAVLFGALGRKNAEPDDRSLDVLLSRLRHKFETSKFTLPIKSVRGIGYVFPKPVTVLTNLEEHSAE